MSEFKSRVYSDLSYIYLDNNKSSQFFEGLQMDFFWGWIRW
jgi:hypothetical protein